jgi:hypothetical protein
MNKFNEQDWLKFREAHKELRYWQALHVYLEVRNIWLEETNKSMTETFYLNDK